VLQEPARKLSELSETIEIRLESPYEKFIKFLISQTLIDTRQFWRYYATLDDCSPGWRETVEDNAKEDIALVIKRSIKGCFTRYGFHAAAAHSANSGLAVTHSIKAHWETRAMVGIKRQTQLGKHGKGRVNSIFLYSSTPPTFIYTNLPKFVVHEQSELLLGFHLAAALDGIEWSAPFEAPPNPVISLRRWSR
jgi:hypothetical protein